MKRQKRKEIWQTHHLRYEPELTVRVRRSEHFFITRLSWFKELSAGAKRAIRFILVNKPTKKTPIRNDTAV